MSPSYLTAIKLFVQKTFVLLTNSRFTQTFLYQNFMFCCNFSVSYLKASPQDNDVPLHIVIANHYNHAAETPLVFETRTFPGLLPLSGAT